MNSTFKFQNSKFKIQNSKSHSGAGEFKIQNPLSSGAGEFKIQNLTLRSWNFKISNFKILPELEFQNLTPELEFEISKFKILPELEFQNSKSHSSGAEFQNPLSSGAGI